MPSRVAYEYPEIVKHAMKISPVRGFTPIIGWLAGSHQDRRYNNKYAQSVVHELEIEISDYTRSHCKNIVEIETRITQCYDQLEELILVTNSLETRKAVAFMVRV